ncbi:MAG: hypothetical protein GYB64_13640 [Chloroflexi bacterium]|nr:hypothetical protein [Chloroflexota bacterium]
MSRCPGHAVTATAVCLCLALMAACTAAETPTLLPTPVAPTPTSAPEPTPFVTEEGGAQALPADNATPAGPNADVDAIVSQAVVLVANRLNIPEARVIPQGDPLAVNWADTSLGCPQPGGTYNDQITPGYRIELAADGGVYYVHADTQGTVVLCLDEDDLPEAGAANDPIVAGFITQARSQLAADLDRDPDDIILLSSESVEWTSSALGCEPPPEADVIDVATAGYRIVFVVDDVRYNFHTDSQRMIRCTTPLE